MVVVTPSAANFSHDEFLNLLGLASSSDVATFENFEPQSLPATNILSLTPKVNE